VSAKIDGSKVRFWSTRKQAEDGARAIGWPLNCIYAVHTRFACGWALSLGVAGPGYLSREEYGRLYHDRNTRTASKEGGQ
jgi:hypothetical protein